jgi:predicted phage terminase large subunit-like protein
MSASKQPRQSMKFRDKDIDDVAGLHYARARVDFAAFRLLKRPHGLAWGWFCEEVARELQHFHRALIAGDRPMLALMAPPQHGKSWTVWDFIAWIAGKHPDLKTIFASYSDELGNMCNRDLKRTIQSDVFARIFPDTKIDVPGWACSNELIEYVGHAGSFRNTTVNGAINGLGLHLGVIDDPVKGRHEASSKVVRDSTWSWFVDDFFNRFAKNAGLLIIMTRWHPDDLLGRAIEKFGSKMRVLPYKAIAEQDETHSFEGKPYIRRKGDALFSEHKPLEFLLERRKLETQASWESLFQQEPFIAGGGRLPIEKLRVFPAFDPARVVASVRYWDKAGTDDDPDAAFTAGCLMHKYNDERTPWIIEHMARGQWSALDREQRIRMHAEADAASNKNYTVWIEQEPGSGGKESAENTLRNLAGFRVLAERVTGSKEVRAAPFEAQVQGGNVWLVPGSWVREFQDECEAWPHGKHLDQVDAAAGAFAKLVSGPGYLTDYSRWV